MRISKVEVFTCFQPLGIPFTHASSGLVSGLEGVYVNLITAEGAAGMGEVRGNCSYFTGDTTGAVVSAISTCIAPALLGKDAQNLNEIHRTIEASVVGNAAAKDACDAAAWDLAARIAGVPVYQLLGGALHAELMSEENIPLIPIEEVQRRTEEILLDGCRFIKLRVGAARFADDIARVDAIWQVIRQKNLVDSVTLSVDANQAWNMRNALDRITALAKYGVTIVEQPVHFDSVHRLLELKRRCPIKLFGDEDAASLADITKLIELGAVDGVHIKLIKCGGITNAIRIMHLAEAHGIDYMVGGMDEGMLAVAAAVHCAAVANTDLFELHGHTRIAQDPSTGLCSRGSFVEVPQGPGFGITVDKTKLKKVFET